MTAGTDLQGFAIELRNQAAGVIDGEGRDPAPGWIVGLGVTQHHRGGVQRGVIGGGDLRHVGLRETVGDAVLGRVAAGAENLDRVHLTGGLSVG